VDVNMATLLGDGRVLAVQDNNVTAEVFDPGTNAFTPTGSMHVSRYLATSTLLKDGRVLVVGGGDDARAELYDPASGTFSLTGSLLHNRDSQTATLLADGRVLIAGGEAGPTNDHFYTSAELYDPATGKFSATGSMKIARENARAVRLQDGRVLIAGGDQGTCGACGRFRPLASAELYDPATGRFSQVGSMSVVRVWQTMTLLNDGRVLVTGGASTDGAPLTSSEIYDPASRTFKRTGDMNVARVTATATLLPGGRVLLAGGTNFDQQDGTASAEIYDPATGAFTPTGSMSVARAQQSATLLRDGRVLIVGGAFDGGLIFEIYWP
jgi:hypothetical protein